MRTEIMETQSKIPLEGTHLLSTLNINILDFWSTKMLDDQNGGFYGRIDGKNDLHPSADKSVILNARILWTFSAAYQLTQNPNHMQMADRACEYLINHFIDIMNGGVYWMLDYKGKVVNDKKQVYAQAFAIYAFSEYHKINPNRNALRYAVELFELLEEHSFDSERNGYYEAFDREWEPIDDVRLSDKDLNATKTMNTHLHLLEAYTNLLRVWPDEQLQKQLKNLMLLLSDRFLTASGHFKLFFDDDWNLLSDEISFGHDIEGSWLLCEAAEVFGDKKLLSEVQKVATKMTWAALEGLDKDGGLMNEAGPNGITDTDKHWWPQAEALVGLVNTWQITGDQAFLTKADKVWRFISEYLIDPDGEWRWKVSRDGIPDKTEDMAGPWKCPYHNGRAMIELLKRLTAKDL